MMNSDTCSVKVFSKLEIQTGCSIPAHLVMCIYLSYCFDLVVYQHTAHPSSNG